MSEFVERLRAAGTSWKQSIDEAAERIESLETALDALISDYISLLTSGHDRIVGLGGECDPVALLVVTDPALKEAQAALLRAKATP